ncbi:hypothetical protein F8M41_004546 [Gigaspora margarita]|uniref:Uncharacterized protein n=1 Tax=Gigaspora margarita TaxID=4874 RepID=A0A8H3XC59_GIGMA|nr:hypothetical protein F8M41_004546 [Gigaspora margarita]
MFAQKLAGSKKSKTNKEKAREEPIVEIVEQETIERNKAASSKEPAQTLEVSKRTISKILENQSEILYQIG